MPPLLDRNRRRAQIIASATVAFARHGYAATSVGQIAEQAGITAPIIYRHFAGKPELYQAVLYDIRDRLAAATRECGDSIRGSVRAAEEDPDGFRLLFRHTAREPEFRDWAAAFARRTAQDTEQQLVDRIEDKTRRRWVARLVTAIAIETILSWLEADRPASENAVVKAIAAASESTVAALA